MNNINAKILVVDAEEEIHNGYSSMLCTCGYTFDAVSTTRRALWLLEKETYDLVLCELRAPDIDGLVFLQKAKEIAPNTPVAILAAKATVDSAVKAVKLGAIEFLEKPINDKKLRWLVSCGLCVSHRSDSHQPRDKKPERMLQFDNMLGQSDTMQEVYEMIQNVAESDASVLITGESGTGKELVARSIHSRSIRNEQPFVPINCSALPENLFEAELFGYEKGAFTGANQRKLGLLEYAHKGTFFLDEVCEMPTTLQAKLLRVLQDKMLRHIGGNELIPVDVRLISASNCNMEYALSEGRLRQDFYFRLNVVNVHLPPLRERREDVPLLAEHFLQRYLKTSAKTISGFENNVISAFECYEWPGNVRELENIVERAITLATGAQITLHELPRQLLASNKNGANSFGKLSLVEAKQEAIDDVESKYLLALLSQHQGNVTKIARDAGMTRRNLHRLLKRHQLNANAWRQTEQTL